MASHNEAIIAAAGSGKTEYILNAALADPATQSLIVTYTNENLREINARLWVKANGPPESVSTMTWFEFLLRHGVKPYQSYRTRICRIRSINFLPDGVPPYMRRDDFDNYYLDRADNVYRDAVSDLAVVLDQASGGKVVARLEGIYGKLFIDEVQDLAGWDLELLELLLASEIAITMVGDPRQAVYLTNRSQKNSQFRGAKLFDWLKAREGEGTCTVTSMAVSHRCNQAICDFADSVYPELPRTTSTRQLELEHTGVLLVHHSHIAAYRDAFTPQDLRWDRRDVSAGPAARNFGAVKGQSFDRVLIHPTSTITNFIETGAPLAAGSAAKFYVAITRARHSVAIVTNKASSSSPIPYWEPGI
jgi:DNA helicase-2/ATP-dependent DNA helicase PcrA